MGTGPAIIAACGYSMAGSAYRGACERGGLRRCAASALKLATVGDRVWARVAVVRGGHFYDLGGEDTASAASASMAFSDERPDDIVEARRVDDSRAPPPACLCWPSWSAM